MLKSRIFSIIVPLLAVLLFLGVSQAVFAGQEQGREAGDPQQEAVGAADDIQGGQHAAAVPAAEAETAPGESESVGTGHGGQAAETGVEHEDLGTRLPLWSGLPFVGILLSIALFPLFAPRFWHHHFPKVSAFWALVLAVPFIIAYKGEGVQEILHIYITDYIPFIVLLWGLFAASGGILLSGTLVGTPAVNLLLLVIGTILASWMGTTGASMVLIRPVLRANRFRKNKMHVVIFFIFLVSNIGGSLTPLGDPPLFLGFLHGVPFFWTFNIFSEFLLVALILLGSFFLIDTAMYRRERTEVEARFSEAEHVPLRLQGLHNLFFLAGIMGAVLFSGMVKLGEVNLFGVHTPIQNLIREATILLMIYLSMKTTSKQIRRDNEFTWFPIKEVAYLFAGIFMTIVPALAMLRAGGEGALAGIVEWTREPAQFFWITGSLSSFLDNAPTYLTFYNLAQGRLGLTDTIVHQMLTGNVLHGSEAVFIPILKAISTGAVFFGAMTYIGNAPNFMVRSIAEENRVKMPSFFGYMLWSIGILVPVFIIVTFVFFL